MPATILLRFGGCWGVLSLVAMGMDGVVDEVDEVVEGGEGERLRLVRE